MLCGTFTASALPARAMAEVLLHTTRTEVNHAVVASVPSQAVARSTYPLVTSLPFSAADFPVLARAHILLPPLRMPAVSNS
jgi:hypothetical protein